MRFLGAIIFGLLGVLCTVLMLMFPFAWFLYLPVVLLVWLTAFLFAIHGLRPRP